jgi:hypothetical protein
MAPKSTSSIYKVFDNVHMLWMGIWIHHHAVTTAQTILSVGEWNQTILSVGEWLGTIVQWLRLKTHLEWFPHPPQAYTRCLKTFICCGWAYGSITTPLPPHLLVQIWEFDQNPVLKLGCKPLQCAVVEA